METQAESTSNDDNISAMKELRQNLETRIQTRHKEQQDLIASLQNLVPDLVSSLNLSIQLISTFNRRPFTPISPPPNPNPTTPRSLHLKKHPLENRPRNQQPPLKKPHTKSDHLRGNADEEGSDSPLSVVRSMVVAVLLERVAACVKERVAFSPIDSSTVLRKLENDQKVTAVVKAALREVGGEAGAIVAVETALRSLAEDNNGGVELEEFVVSGKSRVMVMNIDRARFVRGLPESFETSSEVLKGLVSEETNGAVFGTMPRPGGGPEMWPGDPHLQGIPPMFPGPMMGPRGGGGGPRGIGMMGLPRGMGVPPQHRLPFGPNGPMGGPNVGGAGKQTSEEDVMKDLEALLNKKSFKEMQKSKTGEELLDLIHRPTHKEFTVAAKVYLILTYRCV